MKNCANLSGFSLDFQTRRHHQMYVVGILVWSRRVQNHSLPRLSWRVILIKKIMAVNSIMVVGPSLTMAELSRLGEIYTGMMFVVVEVVVQWLKLCSFLTFFLLQLPWNPQVKLFFLSLFLSFLLYFCLILCVKNCEKEKWHWKCYFVWWYVGGDGGKRSFSFYIRSMEGAWKTSYDL